MIRNFTLREEVEKVENDKVILAVYGLTREQAATESVRYARQGVGVAITYPQVLDYDSREISPIPGQLVLGWFSDGGTAPANP
jgi:hypothetical protein